MAKHNKTALLSLLAGKHDELVNVKLFRGDKDLVTAEEIQKQMHSALLQARMGSASTSKHFPDSETMPVNVAEFVNSL